MVGREQDFPSKPGIESEINYSTSHAPILTFSKAVDTTGMLPSTGIDHYSVYMDKGKLSQQFLDNIPSNGNGEPNYVWLDDENARVTYLYEEDDDATNDLIKVEFKGFVDTPLVEGKHEWTVDVFDGAGNKSSSIASLLVDTSEPSIQDLAVSPIFSSTAWFGEMVGEGSRLSLPGTFRILGFSGLAQDPLSSEMNYYPGGTTQSFEKLSSGPDKIVLTLEKENDKKYASYLKKEYFFGLDKELATELTEVPDQRKEARFYFVTPFAMTDGDYKIKIELFDQVGHSSSKTIYLDLNSKTKYPNMSIFE